jgi:hypothetical protein
VSWNKIYRPKDQRGRTLLLKILDKFYNMVKLGFLGFMVKDLFGGKHT